jgi:hypothetical protein
LPNRSPNDIISEPKKIRHAKLDLTTARRLEKQ